MSFEFLIAFLLGVSNSGRDAVVSFKLIEITGVRKSFLLPIVDLRLTRFFFFFLFLPLNNEDCVDSLAAKLLVMKELCSESFFDD